MAKDKEHIYDWLYPPGEHICQVVEPTVLKIGSWETDFLNFPEPIIAHHWIKGKLWVNTLNHTYIVTGHSPSTIKVEREDPNYYLTFNKAGPQHEEAKAALKILDLTGGSFKDWMQQYMKKNPDTGFGSGYIAPSIPVGEDLKEEVPKWIPQYQFAQDMMVMMPSANAVITHIGEPLPPEMPGTKKEFEILTDALKKAYGEKLSKAVYQKSPFYELLSKKKKSPSYPGLKSNAGTPAVSFLTNLKKKLGEKYEEERSRLLAVAYMSIPSEYVEGVLAGELVKAIEKEVG